LIHTDRPDLLAARATRIESAAAALGIDGWLLTTSHAVRVVTGTWSDEVDLAGETVHPIAAVGDHVLAPAPGPGDPRVVDAVLDHLPPRGRIAVDRLGLAALDRLAERRPQLEVVDAALLLGAAKTPKAPVEIATMTEGLHRTEAALVDMLALVRPGVTERELNAAYYLRALEQGLDHIHVDTVFAVLPRERRQAPWARGEWADRLPYRELTTDAVLRDGDQVAFDAGFAHEGYSTDAGWTLHVGDAGPSPAERDLAAAWDEVARRVVDAARPGATAGDLRRAALRGWPEGEPPPWPYPLYVTHGIGMEPAEPPFAGADFAPDVEEAMVLAEGHVLMVEPYVWREGVGGYRAEYCLVVDGDGARVLNSVDVGHWPGA
jgi:Xaa-Pro aminopeptidase